MNSILDDQNSSIDIMKMPEIMSTTTTTIEDMDITTDEKHRLNNLISK
jgi:hypothetical protein